MENIEKELKSRIEGYDGLNISFIDYVSILNDIFESESIEKDPKIFAEIIENYFGEEIVDIENFLRGYQFDSAREKSDMFFDKFENLDQDFSREVVRNFKTLSNAEKNVFIAVLGNENGVADFIANKCLSLTELGKDALKKNIEEFILSDQMHDKLNKRMSLNPDEASYFLFFEYVRKQMLPSMNHESVMKFYLYAESGNFFKDLGEDDKFREAFVKGSTSDIQKILFKKIKEQQYPLKMVHDDKSSDYTAKIQVQKLPETYIEKPHRTSPSGYIDYAIFDAEQENVIHIINVKAATMESDIYSHDEKSIVSDRALKRWARTNNYTLVVHESQGSHKNARILKHFITETNLDMKAEDLQKVKSIIDTVINRLVDQYTGTEKHIIQPGDAKYTIEDLKQKDAYKVFIEFSKMINDGILNINSSNDSLFKMTSKSIEWLSKNLLRDPSFLLDNDGVHDLRKELKGLRIKLAEKDSISDNIKRLLSDTTPDVINKKIKEATLNVLDRNNKEEKGYYESLSETDLITKEEHVKMDKLRDRIFKFGMKLSDSMISFERDSKQEDNRMQRIKSKYNLIFNSAYAIKSLESSGDKVYFTNEIFKARMNYQKDIEQVFKLVDSKDSVMNTTAISKVLNKIIVEISKDIYLDNFVSEDNNGKIGLTKINYLGNKKEKFIKEAKKLIKDAEELIPELKAKASKRYREEIETKLSDCKIRSSKILKLQNESDDEGFIDDDKLKDLLVDLAKSSNNGKSIKSKI